jgi:dephospho-CoA kinase
MKVIGLTGSFGSGKTFVASIFHSLGAKVIDADKLAHDVIRKPRAEYKRIVKLFGKGILNKQGQIDRKKLGSIVFADKVLLGKLNRIVHPQVIKQIKRSIGNARQSDVLVIDAPLLLEAGLERLVDKLVVVKCIKERQVKRCQEKFYLQKKQVMQRLANQIPLKKKMNLADLVIDNSGSMSRTRKQVRKAWEARLWK